MKLPASAENYLETIFVLQQRNGQVRSIDIVNELSFTKPSVSVAMKNLRAGGWIDIDAAGLITLTEEGLEVAEALRERHEFLSAWLTQIGVPSAIAERDACELEHILSEESFRAIQREYGVKKRTRSVLPSHLL
ncbi:MAG: metal-dependent transcriptional regulator [Clostridia bacterium]|nr:metal-dependent transcriptional regulator [Clostridia bacterium]